MARTTQRMMMMRIRKINVTRCVCMCVCVCGNVFRDIFAIDFQLLNLPYLLCKVQVPYASRNIFENVTFAL